MPDRTALVIDDNPANCDFLARLMTAAGFQVRSSATAAEALDFAAGLAQMELALIDMELPDMNGIQLTGMLRRQFPQAYLVVATMHDEISMIESVFERGGNVFLVKPHGFMELFKRLTTTDLKTLCAAGCQVIDQYGPRPFEVAARQG